MTTKTMTIREKNSKDIERFFGEHKMTSNQYFTFNNVQDEDNIIIITNNVKSIKKNPVLIVGNNEVVYLKDWNIVPVMNWEKGIDAWAVKLNRKYFKVYTFRTEFEDFYFEETETFDSLMEVAKEQQEKGNAFRVKSWTYRI